MTHKPSSALLSATRAKAVRRHAADTRACLDAIEASGQRASDPVGLMVLQAMDHIEGTLARLETLDPRKLSTLAPALNLSRAASLLVSVAVEGHPMQHAGLFLVMALQHSGAAGLQVLEARAAVESGRKGGKKAHPDSAAEKLRNGLAGDARSAYQLAEALDVGDRHVRRVRAQARPKR